MQYFTEIDRQLLPYFLFAAYSIFAIWYVRTLNRMAIDLSIRALIKDIEKFIND